MVHADLKLEGGGVSKTKKFKEMYEVRRSYKQSLPWGRYGYFMELHIDLRIIIIRKNKSPASISLNAMILFSIYFI